MNRGAEPVIGVRRAGFTGSATVQFGRWTGLPHGSSAPQTLREGDAVRIDNGAECEGYASDITRTVVFGKPTARQIGVWNMELAVQTAAFSAIKIGVTTSDTDLNSCPVRIPSPSRELRLAGESPSFELPLATERAVRR